MAPLEDVSGSPPQTRTRAANASTTHSTGAPEIHSGASFNANVPHHGSNSEPQPSPTTEGNTTVAGRLRSASGRLFNARVPVGMWDASATLASTAPSLADIRRGSYGTEGWNEETQREHKSRRASLQRKGSVPNSPLRTGSSTSHPLESPLPSTTEENGAISPPLKPIVSTIDERRSSDQLPPTAYTSKEVPLGNDEVNGKTEPFDNGYQFPPKHTWAEATVIGIKAFWKFFLTPLGFCVSIYGMLVVAFGGMLFLLLVNAAPAMCTPDCEDINSPRRKWIEVDSQIVNALFCVTGLGLIPWRFRDLFFLLQFRWQNNQMALRRLAGIHRGWFRLPGSQDLPTTMGPHNVEQEQGLVPIESLPFPITQIPDAPLTGVRAPPTKLWKLDFVIWMYCWNTFLQIALCGIMWGMTRHNRPAWTTGFLVAVACITAAVGGIMSGREGKKIKGIEGVPITDADAEKLRRDKELGIVHFNNLKDEKPKPKKEKNEKA